MNIFKAIGTLTETIVNTVVKMCGVVDKVVDSADHVADMANETTKSMRDEMRLENQANLDKLQAELNNK